MGENYGVTGPVDSIQYFHTGARLILCPPYCEQWPRFDTQESIRGSFKSGAAFREIATLLSDFMLYEIRPMPRPINPKQDQRYNWLLIDFTDHSGVARGSAARVVYGNRLIATIWAIVACASYDHDDDDHSSGYDIWFQDQFDFEKLKWQIRLLYSLINFSYLL